MDNRKDQSSEENQLDEITFTQHFGIPKKQSEIEFVDIPLKSDKKLFIDPYAITQSNEDLWLEASSSLYNYFDTLSVQIKGKNRSGVLKLLGQLHEPNWKGPQHR